MARSSSLKAAIPGAALGVGIFSLRVVHSLLSKLNTSTIAGRGEKTPPSPPMSLS
jgi:hypothetical protein